MSNCHVKELSSVYAAIFTDIVYTHPTLRKECDRDLTRLRRLVEKRGIHLYLVDLPALGKHLDKCLSSGKYIPSLLPLSGGYRVGVPIPKFLRGLYLLVFEEDGSLKDTPDVEAVFYLRQLLYCAKKCTVPCPEPNVQAEIQSFVSTDESLPVPERFWTDLDTSDSVHYNFPGFQYCYAFRLSEVSEGEQPSIQRLPRCLDFVSGVLATTLGAYNPDDWCFKHGPGAVSQASGPLNKYKWFSWSDNLESVFPIARYGFHNYQSWACSDQSWDNSLVPSRLIAVPKSYSKPRLIAAEPVELQWCQQNIWHFLKVRCHDTWISRFVHLSDQTFNQVLCQRASRTARLATIDLEAASDRVSCSFVGNLFRTNPGLLRALQSTRSRSVRLPSQELHTLRKFATMGNACTFPVESLGFLAVALASCISARKLSWSIESILSLSEEVAVFGDDIVMPVDCRSEFEWLMKHLCFKINDGKTFWSGNFRESCGVDAFRGTDVTPIYWRSPSSRNPDAIASTVEVSNNFYKKFLVTASAVVASTLPASVPVTSFASGHLGLRSFLVPTCRGKTRFNGSLQRNETRVLTISSKVSKVQSEDETALFQFFTENPSPFIHWSNGWSARPKLQAKLRWVPTEEIIAQ